MIKLLMLAGSTLVMPSAPRDYPGPSDYPAAQVRSGEQGRVYFSVLVNPAGAVESCSVIQTSGSAELDAATCALLLKRARYKPARDGTGKRYALDRHSVGWSIPDFKRRPEAPPPPPLLTVTVAGFPDGGKDDRSVAVLLDIDKAGDIVRCEGLTDSKQRELIASACSQMATQWMPLPLTNRVGEKVTYLRRESVLFTIG